MLLKEYEILYVTDHHQPKPFLFLISHLIKMEVIRRKYQRSRSDHTWEHSSRGCKAEIKGCPLWRYFRGRAENYFKSRRYKYTYQLTLFDGHKYLCYKRKLQNSAGRQIGDAVELLPAYSPKQKLKLSVETVFNFPLVGHCQQLLSAILASSVLGVHALL